MAHMSVSSSQICALKKRTERIRTSDNAIRYRCGKEKVGKAGERYRKCSEQHWRHDQAQPITSMSRRHRSNKTCLPIHRNIMMNTM